MSALLADCFFDPSTALCLKRDDGAGSARAPLIAVVRANPLSQRLHHQRHRPAWARAAADAGALLREKRLPPPQRAALQEDLGRFRAVLRRDRPRQIGGPGSES